MTKTIDIGQEFDFDPKTEVEGVWFVIRGDARVLVAAWENPNFVRAFRRLPRDVRRRADSGRLSEDEDRNYMGGIMAQTILLGWENLTEKDQPLKYSRENAFKKLQEHPKFYRYVIECAQTEQAFLVSEHEDDVGNLPKRSGGSLKIAST